MLTNVRNPGLPFKREPRTERSHEIINPAILAWRQQRSSQPSSGASHDQ